MRNNNLLSGEENVWTSEGQEQLRRHLRPAHMPSRMGVQSMFFARNKQHAKIKN
tara:strand:- start:300 stop:461 length:162 start_codon:yes stop_codon:yes gene_type:complete